MDTAYHVDPDISAAAMLPGSFYRDDQSFALARERIFARTWQWLGDTSDVALPESMSPRELLPGLLDEPVLLARDRAQRLRCLSNVCTHRANLLVRVPCRAADIRCGYHGRVFGLDGGVIEAPGFEDTPDFPSAADDLPSLPLGLLGAQAFAALEPAAAFEDFFDPVQQRLPKLQLERGRHDPARDRDYHVAAHWALYIENQLEDLHQPFVHARQARGTAPAAAPELLRYASVQLVPARPGEPALSAAGVPAAGEQALPAAACWVFPNLLLALHPWGMRLQFVLPLAPDRTRIASRSYVWEERRRKASAAGAIDQTEMEDEAIVEQVQRGVRARACRQGRYAPAHERALHHFHRLVCEFMNRP